MDKKEKRIIDREKKEKNWQDSRKDDIVNIITAERAIQSTSIGTGQFNQSTTMTTVCQDH